MRRIAVLALAFLGLTHAFAEPGDLQPAFDDSYVEAESPLATAFVRYCDAAMKRDRAPSAKPACLEAEKEFESVLSTHDRRAIGFLQAAAAKLTDGCAPYAWEALQRISPERFEESRQLASKQKDAPMGFSRWIDSAKKHSVSRCE